MRKKLMLSAVLGAALQAAGLLSGNAMAASVGGHDALPPLGEKQAAALPAAAGLIHSYTVTVMENGHKAFSETVDVPAGGPVPMQSSEQISYLAGEKAGKIETGTVTAGFTAVLYWNRLHPNAVNLEMTRTKLVALRKIGRLQFPSVRSWSMKDTLWVLPGQSVKLPATENGKHVVVQVARDS